MSDPSITDWTEKVTRTIDARVRERIELEKREAWFHPATTERPTFDEYFLGIAVAVAKRSDCQRDKVGAVVVNGKRIRATGYNGAPSGAPGCETCPRRTSGCQPGSSYDNCVAIHAEANALLHCDRADLIGATLYVTRSACYGCRKLILGAGIERVVTP